ncbi:hypothetical protein D3C85_1644270 [compost metagenome]
MGDLAQQRQGGAHVLLVRGLQQLHANVMHHLAGEVAVAEAPAHGVDQFVVVTNQRSKQGQLGGFGGHGW